MMPSNALRTTLGAVLVSIGAAAVAQIGAVSGPPLVSEPPPREFANSTEHYQWLLEQADGGTVHTMATVPRLSGLWVTAGNNSMDLFVDAPGFTGKVREGVLTPAYEEAYKERWREQTELGEVQYDRLTHCEPQGYPRILLEPYTHEFIALPDMFYQINDFASAVRRVYIGEEHSELLGTHSWFGDIIGHWDGNKLVAHTVDLLPADFTRWAPMTSNQFESVEVWELKQYPDGFERLEVQVTFYDVHAFVKPLHAVFAYRRAEDLEELGFHVQHWECETSNNAIMAEDGSTTYRLPGEAGYVDPRGSTLFPQLPGQTRDPENNVSLDVD